MSLPPKLQFTTCIGNKYIVAGFQENNTPEKPTHARGVNPGGWGRRDPQILGRGSWGFADGFPGESWGRGRVVK